ncbi:DUF47 domain-containing protein [Collinsella ihumii]|uniref:DUF47 family protein n=1 Tax=Collinsella ihumii TaxID=1720204 RepID=A0A921IQH1_9ACTN|nr:DUF47 family protein [Collinsella ihumii]MDN0055413.1 DUF47 family protein [Collinsella ihumii]HJG30828.1 DUF47 family protein [Collinsella ihumii]
MARKKDSFYFDSFTSCGKLACQAAQLLADIMRTYDPDRIAENIDAMHEIEQQADEHKHQVLDALGTAFVTPIDREDLAELSDYLDTVVDRIEGVLLRLYFDNIQSIRPDALQLVEMIERSCQEMCKLLEELPQFRRTNSLRDHVITINTVEEEADHVYINAMRKLHTDCNDPMQVFTWHEVYTFLEYCVDSVEHVADKVDSIVMKNS